MEELRAALDEQMRVAQGWDDERGVLEEELWCSAQRVKTLEAQLADFQKSMSAQMESLAKAEDGWARRAEEADQRAQSSIARARMLEDELADLQKALAVELEKAERASSASRSDHVDGRLGVEEGKLFTEEVDGRDASIASLEDQIRRAKTEREDVVMELIASRKRASTTAARLAELRGKNAASRHSSLITQLQASQQASLGRVKELQDQKDQLDAQVEELEALLKELQSQFAEAAATRETLEQELASVAKGWEEEREDLVEQLRSSTEQVHSLEEEVADLRSSLSKHLEDHGVRQKEWAKKVDDAEELWESECEKVKMLEKKIVDLQKSLMEQSKAQSSLESEWSSKLEEAMEFIKSGNALVQNLQSQSSQAMAKVTELETTLTNKEKWLNEEVIRATRLEDEVVSQSAQIKTLEEKLGRAKDRRIEVVADLTSLLEEAASLVASLKHVRPCDANEYATVVHLEACLLESLGRLQEDEDTKSHMSVALSEYGGTSIDELRSQLAEAEAMRAASMRKQDDDIRPLADGGDDDDFMIPVASAAWDQAKELLEGIRQELEQAHEAMHVSHKKEAAVCHNGKPSSLESPTTTHQSEVSLQVDVCFISRNYINEIDGPVAQTA